MSFEIVRRSVCTTNTLEPTIRAFNLSVPAVLGVVSHFIRKMLAESQAFLVNTQLSQEQVSPCNEVA